MLFVLSLSLGIMYTEGRNDRVRVERVAAMEEKEAKYFEQIPFVQIGPDWGEDKLDIKKIYKEEKKNSHLSLDQEESCGEYDNFAFCNVDDYVNVRNIPSTEGEIVGRIYDGSVAEILETAGEKKDWYKIVSGNVKGYIKAEYFLRGEEAAQVMDRYIICYALVNADYLNVRSEPTTESKRVGVITQNEKVKLLEDIGDWVQIQYSQEEKGFVSSAYVTLTEEFLYARTLEEIEEEKRQEKEALEKRRKLEESTKESDEEEKQELPIEVTPVQASDSMQESAPVTESLGAEVGQVRNKIISHAMQYEGNKYVPGGRSLAGGTDCSGFTCFIYADFGYSISRTPQGQYTSAGRSIAYEEIQPGDIICYSSNGGKSCTHVGIYIGNGQIIHSANSRKGVIVQNADYDRIIGVKNVID